MAKNGKSRSDNTGLGARLAVGVLGALFAVASYTIVWLALSISHPRVAAEAVWILQLSFGKASVLTAALGFLVGVLLGARRMAEIFSFCWGTHPWWRQERNQKLAGAVALLLVVIFIVYQAAH